MGDDAEVRWTADVMIIVLSLKWRWAVMFTPSSVIKRRDLYMYRIHLHERSSPLSGQFTPDKTPSDINKRVYHESNRERLVGETPIGSP